MPLKDLLRARFDSAIKSIPPPTWKILITDRHSQALLDTVYSNYNILQQNVTSVEPLHSPRQPMTVDAIYLLTPTSQNVSRIIADFSNGRRTYKSAHIYFIDGIDDRLADKLTGSLPPDVLKAFVELYCNFWPLEDRVFTMKRPSAFYSMFGNVGGAASGDLAMEAFEDDVKLAGRQVLNLLTAMNETPYIRYYQPTHHPALGPLSAQASNTLLREPPSQPSELLRWRSAMGPSGATRQPEQQGMHLSKKLALQVQSDLEQYRTNNPEFPPATNRPRAVLFIVDRSMDPAAPLLHEFWYQAMVHDLLPIKDGRQYKYTYENTVGGKEQKEAVLDDADPIWCSVRHLHMKDAIDTLMTNFGKFAQEHAGFAGGAQPNVKDLQDMLANLPQFQTQREQYSLHLDMAQECMALFERKKMNLAAHVEQCCATGYTADGKTPKNVVEEMVPLLDEKSMTNWDKARVIALYILFRDGVADEDRRRLYQHARLSLSEQDAVNNLVYLGAKVIRDAKDRSRNTRIKQKASSQEGEYELSRYRPIVQQVLEDHHSNRLDQRLFPFLGDIPPELQNAQRSGGASLAPPPPAGGSLRSARPTWHKAPSTRNANTEGRQRMIIFVAGGMTYSEMRLAYTLGLAMGKEIFIGSTHVVTPEDYMKDLRYLGRGGVGSNPPNAIPLLAGHPGRAARSPGAATPYQTILDQLHWEPYVGPPQSQSPPHMPPPPNGTQPSQQPRPPSNRTVSASNLSNRFSDLSMTGLKDSKLGLGKRDGEKKDGEKKEKKGLMGKMKW